MRVRPAQACDHGALESFLKRWNALRAVYRDRESLLDWDLAQHPDPAVVATGSAKRFQLFLAIRLVGLSGAVKTSL